MNPERLLLVRPSALGDVVQCLPALACLRAARPEAEIGWVIEDRHEGIVKGHPHLDRVFTFHRKTGGFRAMVRLTGELRDWRPDVAVDLQGNMKSGIIMRLSGAPRRIGLAPGEERERLHFAATETVQPGPKVEHRADRALRLVAPLGAKPGARAELPPISPEINAQVVASLAALGVSRGGYALLVTGTSDYGAFKRWPPARFGDFAQRLRAERGVPSLVGFGPGQRALADAVVAASGGAARHAPETGSLHGLLALTANAAFVVGADSGPVGIAAALGVPTVTLFGPKNPAIYAPRGPRTAVVWKAVYCSPCKLRKCGDPICMSTIEADDTLQAVESVGAFA